MQCHEPNDQASFSRRERVVDLDAKRNDHSCFEESRAVWAADHAVRTESSNPRNYWNMLKARTKSEGFDAAMADIVPLKLKSADNRFRLTDTANRAALLRIIQSIPSPRTEPFRLWLAQVGDERLEEIEHSEAAIERGAG